MPSESSRSRHPPHESARTVAGSTDSAAMPRASPLILLTYSSFRRRLLCPTLQWLPLSSCLSSDRHLYCLGKFISPKRKFITGGEAACFAEINFRALRKSTSRCFPTPFLSFHFAKSPSGSSARDHRTEEPMRLLFDNFDTRGNPGTVNCHFVVRETTWEFYPRLSNNLDRIKKNMGRSITKLG